ncbi:hypothetical protein J6590_007467 [Homalodisca vitripennis]|nr:hypothetical protein J6590_007467 [Homalodisca vitripennis]
MKLVQPHKWIGFADAQPISVSCNTQTVRVAPKLSDGKRAPAEKSEGGGILQSEGPEVMQYSSPNNCSVHSPPLPVCYSSQGKERVHSLSSYNEQGC